MMRAALLLTAVACVPAPVVRAPVTIVVQPAPSAPPCFEERVLLDDEIATLADAGTDGSAIYASEEAATTED